MSFSFCRSFRFHLGELDAGLVAIRELDTSRFE
jgi:hypothetical protein